MKPTPPAKRTTVRAIGASLVLGVLTNVFAAGCIGGPGCWERCEGNLECDVYSKTGCPTAVGCKVADKCLCSSPDRGAYAAYCNFSDAGTKCAQSGDSEQSCTDTTGCAWGPGCTGLVVCSKFQDAATCGKYPNACTWAKDCG